MFQGIEIPIQLADSAGTNDGGGDPGVAQYPRKRHLSQ